MQLLFFMCDLKRVEMDQDCSSLASTGAFYDSTVMIPNKFHPSKPSHTAGYIMMLVQMLHFIMHA